MPWDTTTPADDEPIRKLGEIGRDHWLAIQDADTDVAPFLNYRSLQMADRTALGVAVDPVVASATSYIYNKQDGGGTQELYVRDAASNIIQVTNDGKIGSTATNFEADSVSFDGTVAYDEHNMFRAWGLVNLGMTAWEGTSYHGFAAGAITAGGTGVFTVDITGLGPAGASFADGNSYGVLLTTERRGGRNHIANIDTRTATSFRVVVTNDANSASYCQVTVALLA